MKFQVVNCFFLLKWFKLRIKVSCWTFGVCEYDWQNHNGKCDGVHSMCWVFCGWVVDFWTELCVNTTLTCPASPLLWLWAPSLPPPQPLPPSLHPPPQTPRGEGSLSLCELHQDDGALGRAYIIATLWSVRHVSISHNNSAMHPAYGITNEERYPAMFQPWWSSQNQRPYEIITVKAGDKNQMIAWHGFL